MKSFVPEVPAGVDPRRRKGREPHHLAPDRLDASLQSCRVPSALPSRPAPVLVIGYGNELRGDDAVGVAAGTAIESLQLPDVQVLTCHQLLPELAEVIASARRVIFVDAEVGADSAVRVRPLTPSAELGALAHVAHPQTLLSMARHLYGQNPEGWWITVPVASFEVGAPLSDTARRGLAGAIERIRALCLETSNVGET